MSEKNGDRREGDKENRPESRDGRPSQPQDNEAASPDEAQQGSRWDSDGRNDQRDADNQQTQAFQPDHQQGPQDTQAFQPGYQPDDQGHPNGYPHQAYPYGQGGYQNPPEFDARQHGQQGYGPDRGYGQPQYGQQGYGHYGGQPGAYPPSYGGGYDGAGGYPPYGPYGQPPEKGRGPIIAWIVLGVLLLAAIAVGILFAMGVIGGEQDSATAPTGTETLTIEPTASDPVEEDSTAEEPTTDPTAEPTTPDGTVFAYGDDPALDALWDSCEGGNMADCDELYFSSGVGTEYEEFGNTCGGSRENAYGLCDADAAPSQSSSYGDDPELDALWDACEEGDFAACDELWWNSPIDSEYESFAESCGGRADDVIGVCEVMAEAGEL